MRKLSILLKFFNKINNMSLYSLFTPSLILMILSMLILPLPSFVLDLFFTFNIIVSIIILIVSMFVTDVLSFSSFPIVSLFSTLLRLSLNVASTRVILLNGHMGLYSAGHVIESFGVFLIGGNFFIGIIVFIILIIINFIVITKGSGRIAEVGARFILDAMPGKQMAIDADLNAGIISEKEAKKRRMNVYKEADFYGSMDGSSKFIRGDAIAGIIIIIVNIIGGLIVGMIQHNMSFLQAAQIYSILTIGDGLAAQIPSLVISIASGVLLTRIGSEKINVSEQIISQIFNNSQVIFLSGIVFSMIGLIPGMPNFIFLFFSISLLILSWYLYSKNNVKKSFSKIENIKENKILIFSWNDIQFEYLIALELSSIFFQSAYQDKHDYLLKKIYFLRKNIAKDFGFLISDIHLIHNCKLEDGQYKILIKGVEHGCGHIFLDKLLVINNNISTVTIPGIQVKEPVFDLPAFWIDSNNKEIIIKKKLLIVKPISVIITHINKIIRKNLYDLFGFQETQQLLDRISQIYPRLVECLIPNIISVTILQNILQNLLYEHISIKDIRTILETLIKYGNSMKNDVDKLTNIIRIALRNFITQKFFLNALNIHVIGLSPKIECILLKIINTKGSQLEPLFSEKLIKQAKLSIVIQKKNKSPLVLLVRPELRSLLVKLFITSVPELTVLSFLEISENRTIKIVHTIGRSLE
ncbi:Flagellar biosynthesis protein FlhA [Buchnera aphidicola (Cinara cuneomaculata)]|uniref:Flagellar biosynthesis protein FlhA n=1 Tax=Buchnera aphidicola (Cinara cuneomaculata) TaxID=1660040 RepID=A0A451CYD1_9GAMM|nr:FHIPEP family type III secretion protein [Buchnera aphidicola]VFP78150.1 Flagellar biosynthesis protein FlhA [Buchnera aphidicola (Cinara cuneomaculata)]